MRRDVSGILRLEGERLKAKGERRKAKGERRKAKGERRKAFTTEGTEDTESSRGLSGKARGA
jgi:hypothetical protein